MVGASRDPQPHRHGLRTVLVRNPKAHPNSRLLPLRKERSNQSLDVTPNRNDARGFRATTSRKVVASSPASCCRCRWFRASWGKFRSSHPSSRRSGSPKCWPRCAGTFNAHSRAYLYRRHCARHRRAGDGDGRRRGLGRPGPPCAAPVRCWGEAAICRAGDGRMVPEIGIGGSLAAPPLPHHRAYGSVPRRFERFGHHSATKGGSPSDRK